ncbi:MAG TPA: hypothetical protein DIT07_14575 [Sphingobacteriaceae bacterium]|nr:hypothetical protein [Sphingobacteriaceae bacterium]
MEWNDQLEAYNKNTGIFYTIANDNSNLYLTIKATDQNIIRKIVLGGITFTINTMGGNKNGAAISFPAYYGTDPLFFITTNNRPESDVTKNKIQMDSMNARNKQLKDRFKKIGVRGIQTIKDCLYSPNSNLFESIL